MKRLLAAFGRLARDARGVAAIEYGVAAALMSAAIVSFLSDTSNPDGLLGRIKALMDSILT